MACIQDIIQQLFYAFSKLGGERGVCSAGGDGKMNVAAANACGRDEIAIRRRIGDIHGDSARLGITRYGGVDLAIVRGGESKHRAVKIAGAVFPFDALDRQIAEAGVDSWGHYRYVRTGLDQRRRFPKCNRAAAGNHHPPSGDVQE